MDVTMLLEWDRVQHYFYSSFCIYKWKHWKTRLVSDKMHRELFCYSNISQLSEILIYIQPDNQKYFKWSIS